MGNPPKVKAPIKPAAPAPAPAAALPVAAAAATPAVVPQVKTAASEYPSRMSDDEKSLHSFLFLSDVQQPFPFFLPLRFAPRLSLAFLFFRWTTVAL